MFCTIEDMSKRFGYEDLNCVSKKQAAGGSANIKTVAPDLNIAIIDESDPLATDTDKRVLCHIEDACQFIMQKLGCCFDLSNIFQVYAEGREIGILKKWTVDIAYYYLHDRIKLSSEDYDHESHRRYKDAIKAIKSTCDCGILFDSEMNQISKKVKGFLLVEECKYDALCEYWKDQCYNSRAWKWCRT